MSGIERIAGDVAGSLSPRSIGDVMQDTDRLDRRQQAHQRGGCVEYLPVCPVDRITGGWRGGRAGYPAARPAMGKTTVALHFAQAAAGAVSRYVSFAGDARYAARRPQYGGGFGDATRRSGRVRR